MNPPSSEPRALYREAELARVLDAVRGTLGPDGPLPGARVHMAVTAPHGGGLTVFLEDVEGASAADPRLFPVRVVSVEPTRWVEDVEQGVARMWAGASVSPPERQGLSTAVVDAAQSLWERTGRLAVLILDLGVSLRQLGELPSGGRLADPLLEFLRAAVNIAEDRAAPIALVVGWGDEFRRTLQSWRRHDVDQRYYPVVPLWPGFGRATDTEAWACYRGILEAHRYTVEGDYPGFVRAEPPIAVGEVLDRLRGEVGRRSVDGRFLIGLLRQRRPHVDPNVATLDPDALVALCLQDRAVSEEPGRTAVETGFTSWVEAEGGGLRATAGLYAELGLNPPRTVVGLRDEVAFRYAQPNDTELAAEILRGVQVHLDATGESPPIAVGYAAGRFRLTSERPAGSSGLDVVAFASFGQALDHTVAQEVAVAVRAVEDRPDGRASGLVLVLTRQSGPGSALYREVNDQLARVGVRTPVIPGGRPGIPDRPVALAVVELSEPQAVQAVARARGDQRPKPDLEAVRQQLQDHFTRVAGVLPPLVPLAFRPPVLTLLQQRSHQPQSARELHDALSALTPEGPPTLRDVTAALQSLESAGAIQKVPPGRYRWTFASDRLLADLREGLPQTPDDLFKRLAAARLLDRTIWQEVLPLLRAAYRDFINERGIPIGASDPRVPLGRRLADWCDQLGRAVETLRVHGEVTAADDVRGRLVRIEQALNEPEPDLHQLGQTLAELTCAAEAARVAAQNAAATVRQRVEELIGEVERKELRAERQAELRRMRERVTDDLTRSDLEAVERDLRHLSGLVDRDQSAAEAASQATAEVARGVARLRQRLEAATQRLAPFADRGRAAELVLRVGQSRQILDEVGTALGAEMAESPYTRRQRLNSLRQRLAEAEQLVPASEEIAAATRLATPRAPRPREPVRPPGPPSADGVPDAPVPTAPPSVGLSGPVEPTKAPEPSRADGGDAPVKSDGPVSPLVTLPRPARTPAAVPESPPVETRESVAGSSPAAVSEAPGVIRRTEQFTQSPDDLRALAELLGSPARIIDVEIDLDDASRD